MMKISALVAALALTCGTAAFAAQPGDGESGAKPVPTATADTKASGDGLVAKTKRALHRVGDKISHIGHKAGDKVSDTVHSAKRDSRKSDTRSMGARRDDDDSSRQARMDAAYENSQKTKKY